MPEEMRGCDQKQSQNPTKRGGGDSIYKEIDSGKKAWLTTEGTGEGNREGALH